MEEEFYWSQLRQLGRRAVRISASLQIDIDEAYPHGCQMGAVRFLFGRSMSPWMRGNVWAGGLGHGLILKGRIDRQWGSGHDRVGSGVVTFRGKSDPSGMRVFRDLFHPEALV